VPSPLICLVTGNHLNARETLELIAAAARGGVGLVQIRERRLDDRSLLDLAARAVTVTTGTGCRVLVNERVDLALAAGAAGVHLRGSSFAASRVRAMVPAGFIIGRSVHTLVEAQAAGAEGGCDYLLFGTVFASPSKPADHPIAGVDALASVCKSARLPVLAIGGVTPQNAAEVARAGAAGVAGISLFEGAPSISAAVAALRRAFDS
jgi:thiamine-phosphate pyrophosphorylase